MTSEHHGDESAVIAWLDNRLKALLVAFYQQNPGVVETIPGLARRIGVSESRIQQVVEEHIELGLLHRVDAHPEPFFMFNRKRQADLQKMVADRARRAMWAEEDA